MPRPRRSTELATTVATTNRHAARNQLSTSCAGLVTNRCVDHELFIILTLIVYLALNGVRGALRTVVRHFVVAAEASLVHLKGQGAILPGRNHTQGMFMKKANAFHTLFAAAAVAGLGLGATAVPAAAECNSQALGVIKSLNGSWRGSGTVKPIGGQQERISCRVSYNNSGAKVAQKISCSSSDFKFEASADVQCSENSLSGMWTEKVANNTGSVSGRIDGQKMNFEVNGPNFQGRIDVRVASASSHSLTITQFDPAAGRQVPVATVALTH